MPQPRSRKPEEGEEPEAEAAPEQQSEQQGQQPAEGTYPTERLIAESADFLGVESYIAAGAFEGHDEEEMTLDQAKGYVEEFQDRVVTGDAEDEE